MSEGRAALRGGDAEPSVAAPQAVAGDLAMRYDRLIANNGDALLRTAASYEADPGRREDLFQEVCLAIWRALPTFRGECTERTFAFRIAHNRGLSHAWKRRGARAVELDNLEDGDHRLQAADRRPNPEAAASDGQRRRRLRAAIRTLPLGQRQVLTLSLEGLSYREMAEVLGLTESNVGVRLNRAKRALRAHLEKQPGESLG